MCHKFQTNFVQRIFKLFCFKGPLLVMTFWLALGHLKLLDRYTWIVKSRCTKEGVSVGEQPSMLGSYTMTLITQHCQLCFFVSIFSILKDLSLISRCDPTS